jgi:hypothetical protein
MGFLLSCHSFELSEGSDALMQQAGLGDFDPYRHPDVLLERERTDSGRGLDAWAFSARKCPVEPIISSDRLFRSVRSPRTSTGGPFGPMISARAPTAFACDRAATVMTPRAVPPAGTRGRTGLFFAPALPNTTGPKSVSR